MNFIRELLLEERWHLQSHPRQTAEMRARIAEISIQLSFGASGHADPAAPVPLP